MYFSEINTLDYYSVEWNSACVGVYQLLSCIGCSMLTYDSSNKMVPIHVFCHCERFLSFWSVIFTETVISKGYDSRY